MKIAGIAGGSGSGKSTVSYFLVDQDPDIFEAVNLDDYQKLRSDPDLPMLAGMINWDHPDVIRWDALISDLEKLRAGEEVTINVWSHRSNPDYHKHRTMIPRTIRPKKILILEGYLALYNRELLSRFSRKYFLELNEEVRCSRRAKNDVVGNPGYESAVLVPMHRQYVEPTKQNADVVLDVSEMTVSQVAAVIREDILRG